MYAHSAEKVGVDAAELAGWPRPTGVAATNDIAELVALRPDACCYNPLWPNIDELVTLLSAGINVCASAAWITGGKQSPADLDRIGEACRAGGSTMFGSGAHPGMTNLIGMALSGRVSGSTRSASPSRWTAPPTNRPTPWRRWGFGRDPTPGAGRVSASKVRSSRSPRR